jgi:hypothetical protein
MIRTTVTISVLLVLGACTPTPKLLRHYDRLDTQANTDAPQTSLKISTFAVSPKQNPSSALISQLSEKGQAELIKAVAGRLSNTAKPADLIASLSEPAKAKERPCGWADQTSVSRRIAVTLHGSLAKPADRIDSLTVTLTLPGDSIASFTSWDRFDSAYASFNVGSATLKQSRKLTINRDETETRNLPLSAGTDVNVFKFTPEISNELNESAAYSVRRLSLGGALSEKKAELIQEGGPNVNLFGTSVATVSLRLDAQESLQQVFRLTLTKDSKPAAPADVAIERCLANYPKRAEPIKATVAGTAILRDVQSEDGTVSEGDDVVKLRQMPIAASNLDLVDSATLEAKLYGLARCERTKDDTECTFVEIENPATSGTPNSTEELRVESFSAATELRSWLIESAKKGAVTQIGGKGVGLGRSLRPIALDLAKATHVLVVWDQN